MNPVDNQHIKEALAACLSGVEALPSRRGEILRAAKGEKKVKKTMSKGLVLALILMLMMGTVALAAELGPFGRIGQQNVHDTRLPGLDTVAAALDKTFTTPEGATLTVHQAYYDGSRVFVSYTLEGEAFVHDGMQSGDTYLEIIGGDFYEENGLEVGWKECEVPAGVAADEMTFAIGTFNAARETTWHEFTVKKDDSSKALTGSGKGAAWTATATLTASAIDVKGEVTMDCPVAWTDVWRTWENPGNLDYIHDWHFYIDGERVEGYNLAGGITILADGRLSFGVCYKLDACTEDMMLVPVYNDAGENLEEAIHLTLSE